MTTPSLLGPGAAVLAFDVGGTDTKAALVDETGTLIEITRTPTPLPPTGTEFAVLDEVDRIASGLRAKHPNIVPTAAGLIVPGLVDDEAGIGRFSENLRWTNVPFRDLASERLGMPVSFTHDVRGAGEAEYRLGTAGTFPNAIVVVIGTGIASAIFIDGKPYAAHGYAGELGHSIIVPGGRICACGGHGCLEAIASAGAITRRYNTDERASLPVNGARDVLQRAKDGDALATEIWESALDTLALALAQTVAMFAPDAIIIGGGLSQAGDDLFVPLGERLESHLTFHRRPQLLCAGIGENAGLVGAALKARDLAALTRKDAEA